MKHPRTYRAAVAAAVIVTLLPAAPAIAEQRSAVPSPTVSGPLPGTVPGDRLAPAVEDTYPFFSTPDDLAANGYVEQEFHLSGVADGWDTQGVQIATDVPYRTRIVVRRPARDHRFNGTALVEWQNVTAGYDLDALWNGAAMMRAGYAWIGVSAQRVGVDQLRGWSPARYGALDVTGGGRYLADELSYDIFAQAAKALGARRPGSAMGGLDVRTVLAIGASQSAARMTVYYQSILPKVEPVFQVLSETDVRTPVRPSPDTGQFRRWEVAGGAHSGWHGQQYRTPISVRDLGAAPVYDCAQPPFSRVPVNHATAAAYDHLVRWVRKGVAPPTARPLVFNADGTKARDSLGLALGGIRYSQVTVPTARNTGDNAGQSFCFLFGSHQSFDQATLDELYPTRGSYLAQVVRADLGNVHAGYLLPADALGNLRDAVGSAVGG